MQPDDEIPCANKGLNQEIITGTNYDHPLGGFRTGHAHERTELLNYAE